MTATREFHIQDLQVLTTGAEGGHYYGAGFCQWNDRDLRVFVFMLDRHAEEDLRRLGSTNCLVRCGRCDFIEDVGLFLSDCTLLNDGD